MISPQLYGLAQSHRAEIEHRRHADNRSSHPRSPVSRRIGLALIGAGTRLAGDAHHTGA